MRVCSKCGRELPLSEFGKRKKSKDGLQCYCKECAKEVRKRYIEANPEKAKEYSKKYRDANTDKMKESIRKWQEANREKVKESNRKWRRTNHEKVKESNRKWRRANPEKVKEHISKWRRANPEKAKEYIRRRVVNCYNNYVRTNLIQAGIPSEQITPELIEIKRTIIKIKRKLKWKTQE